MSNDLCGADKLVGDDGAEMTVSLLQSELTIRHAEVRNHAKRQDERRKANDIFKPEMFNGCTHIFIDAGSNRGTHVRKLFEPQKYPGTPYFPVLDKAFGEPAWRTRSSAETGICAFGFEANPVWTETLTSISEAYAKQGWRATWFVPVFVSNHSGDTETFYVQSNGAGENSDWEASTVPISSDWENPWTKTPVQETSIQVPNIDISSFMQMLNQYANPGNRLMKMDIESAEFTVLPKFLEKKLLCKSKLTALTIEWHDKAPFMYPNETKYWDAEKTKREVLSSGKCDHEEDTLVLDFDDESYRDDGMPLP
jgi:hypothetical protein